METNERDGVYGVLAPTSDVATAAVTFAPGVTDLRGKTVCEMWDRMFHGEDLFPLLREELAARFPEVRFVPYTEFGDPNSAEEASVLAALPEALRSNGCDVLISGIGG